MQSAERERTASVDQAAPKGPGWSALLTEVAEVLRRERKELERHADWRSIAAAEREISGELASEAARRLREALARRERRERLSSIAESGEHQRFSLLFRLQHMGLLVSTLTLIVTGMPLRYAETAWAHVFFRLVGGVPAQAFLHRSAAALLIAVAAFHVCYIALTREGRGELVALIPRVKDFGDLFRNLGYFVGFVARRPRFDRFSYVEKFDYWAVYWGIVVMVGSGLLLWAPEISMRVLPKYALDIAKAVHSDEALLAATAIVVWHFYNTHLNPDCFPMNMAWLTGRISREHLRKHHRLEYDRYYPDADSQMSDGDLS